MKINTQHILIIILLLVGNFAYGQRYNQELDEFNPEAKRQDKFGIRLGFCLTRLNSPQLSNMNPTRGYQGAFYYRVNLFKRFHLNPEFGASVDGAKFNNGKTGYSQISMLYFDFSLIGLTQLDAKNNHNLVLGLQASRLMRSSLFIGPEQNPSYLQLPFKKYDYAAILGYHYNLQYVGFQLALKYGLSNIAGDFNTFQRKSLNDNSQFENLNPSLRDLKQVQNLSIELSLYF